MVHGELVKFCKACNVGNPERNISHMDALYNGAKDNISCGTSKKSRLSDVLNGVGKGDENS